MTKKDCCWLLVPGKLKEPVSCHANLALNKESIIISSPTYMEPLMPTTKR